MAKILQFYIKNFKGIEETLIALDGRRSTPIVTLVGLNESGKTTLLEALSHFVSGDSIVTKIFEEESANSESLSLIPIQKKANFTGTIEIGAKVQLDKSQIEHLGRIIKLRTKYEIEGERFARAIDVSRIYEFKDGNVVSRNTLNWDASIYARAEDESEYVSYQKGDDEEKPDLYSIAWNFLFNRLPTISYFPTFLVDMPSRIYLTEHDDETPTNRYYRSVLQDVLDSLDENLDLDTHVAQRIRSYRETSESAYWFSEFWSTPIKRQIDSVFQKISNAISKEIIGSWNKVFHRPISAKGIHVDWQIDTKKDNLPYAEISISDGESQYALHERSLGFRWFFSFLLFTRFKQSKDKQTIFLFDEPAANLHARAQSELLDSFGKIIEGGHKVIYSTHSHYMINPKWLSGTYIIENEAIDYDSNDMITGLDSRPTKVRAIPYREFVSSYPDRISYFQPIMEKLKYANPKLSPDKPIVLTEGISDYYAFSVISHAALKKAPFTLMPGLGAGASGPLIAMLMASAKPFLLLFDDDRAGRKERDRYRNDWLLPDANCLTLADMSEKFSGKKLETLLSEDTHKKIGTHFGKVGQLASKKDIGNYFSELNYQRRKPSDVSEQTRKELNALMNEITKTIQSIS